MTTIAFDPYIVDTLLPDLVGHDRQPSAFLVYLYLWRQTHGGGQQTVRLALLDIADATGLSKRAVQDALGRLAKRKLLSAARERITAVPVYTVFQPWRRPRGARSMVDQTQTGKADVVSRRSRSRRTAREAAGRA